jgi:hypothetical protein
VSHLIINVMALGLHGGVDRDRLRSLVRNAPPASCATRRLSASRSSSFSPRRFLQMAQGGALVREGVLEETPRR